MLSQKKWIYLSERGFAPVLMVLLLVIGLIIAVFLVKTRTNILPHASEDSQDPKTAFHLLLTNYAHPMHVVNGETTGYVFHPGEEIKVDVAVSSDIESTNTFSAVVSYPKDLLEVTSIIKNPETVAIPDYKNKYPKMDSHLPALIESSNRAEFIKTDGLQRDQNGRVAVGIRVDKAGLTAADLNYQALNFVELVNSDTYLQIDGFIPVDNLVKMADNPHVQIIMANFAAAQTTAGRA
jgi:hypothetical protein